METGKNSSFKASRLNDSTFLIIEDDSYGERPFIYAKILPREKLITLTDTGCDSPSKASAGSRFVHLRDYLEHYSLACNDNKPLNSGPNRMRYQIICSHCHYDHTLGLPQFQHQTDSTEIIASAQGRDFIESNLGEHGLFDYLSIPVPEYKVTHWAQSYESLYSPEGTRLGIRMIATPGHTPDSLAWYDEEYMHLYVGDSLYEDGPDQKVPIIWPFEGNMIDWYYSMSKLLQFVRSQNAEASRSAIAEASTLEEEWIFIRGENTGTSNPMPTESSLQSDYVVVGCRVKLAAGHETSSADAEYLIEKALKFLGKVLRDEIPGEEIGQIGGKLIKRWQLNGYGLHFVAPIDVIDTARGFFGDKYVV